MNQQITILSGDQLATQGLQRAVTKADNDYTDWSDRCWDLFLKWLGKKPVGFHFLVEDFRNDLLTWNKIEAPENNRVFGFISRRAVSQRLIVSAGKAKTKSSKSHSANAEVWRKI